ncbi:Cas9 endonuclease PAM-interacting domain-containing protein [uncultured Ruminococcus sp.]|uniref:Cas9 endonuclease PAM-interacting domain-containing protein n=1 Tax=uncultured Ruminococcus sp. TaxID=165186 RepID=UPI003452F489
MIPNQFHRKELKLKAFHCNRVLSDLTQISGPGTAGSLSVSKNQSKCKQAYLIHQYVTGLYQYRTDLLCEECTQCPEPGL